MLLKPARAPRGPLGVFFRGFNRVFDTATTGYIGVARLLIRRAVVTILLVGVVVVGVGLLGRRIPAGFIPDEDQGLFGVAVQLPPAASLERTSAMLRKVEEILAKVEAVDSYQTIGGYGAVTSTYQPNFGSIFVRLKPWEERHEEALHVKGIMARVNRELVQIPEAVAFPFNIPTISGFGAAAGFNFLLQDRSGSLTVDQLGAQTRAFLAAARQRPEFASLFTAFDPTYPQVKVELDREKARTLGVPVSDVFQAMSAAMGGTYVNDFNRFGRLYRVYVQADADYRRKPGDIGDVYVRSKTTSTMIPLSTLVTITTVQGTELTTRFNLLRSGDNNVYVQIGLIMLVGLAAKNAILIVEFAKAKHEEGQSVEAAALESARLRFRPILMTAFAFILGVVPLMLASGAGAGAQNVMGTAVFWGMLIATGLGVFLIPGNFAFVEGLGRKRSVTKHPVTEPDERLRSEEHTSELQSLTNLV